MRYNILIIIFIFLFSSCEDFLEEKSKDKIIPTSVENYEELLYGEAYLRADNSIASYLDIMTDDVKCYAKTSGFNDNAREDGFGYFTWQADPELAMSGARNEDGTWEWLYHSILMCNMTINDAGELSGGKADRESLMAEAYFLRAFDYFMLVNLYGEPYNKESASQDMGVPINTVIGMEDVCFKRSTVEEVYKQIMDDLKKSIELFESSKKVMDIFKANIDAAYLLASRTSLYMKEYKDAIDYAALAIGNKPSLYNLKTKNSSDKFINHKNPELLFTFGYHYIPFHSSGYFTRSSFHISQELSDLYDSDDLRKPSFFSGSVPKKADDADDTGAFGFALRSAEAYLNRAEAYAEKGEIKKAIDDINKIRQNRFSTDKYKVSASTKEEAITIVREERRRELCFEKHRWFDIRRWGTKRIEHIFKAGDKKLTDELYVLEKNDAAFTLPLPYKEKNRNKEIKNIDRKDRKPENNQ